VIIVVVEHKQSKPQFWIICLLLVSIPSYSTNELLLIPPFGCRRAEKVADFTKRDVYFAITGCSSRRPRRRGRRLAQKHFATFSRVLHPMNKTMPTEISLEALIAGDRAEFARLVDTYSSPIYRLGLRMLGNSQDAEDVLQNTFLNALTHIQNFEGRSSLATWLYRIASNEALMLIRKKKPEVNLEDVKGGEEDEDLRPTQFVDWSALPEDELLSGEGKKALDEAIHTLPESLRIVFLLRDVEGLSIKETAEALNLTETNVKTRLLRARMALREGLSTYYGERLPARSEK
jgi:RNA polymerase sigma-70 factor, ECF subfamily